MLCMRKEKMHVMQRTIPQMSPDALFYLVLERIASKYPQATAEPNALFVTFSPPPGRPLGED